MASLRIVSLNVRGLGSSRKLNKIIYELNNLMCDVFFLQKAHVSCKKQAELFEKFGMADVSGCLEPVNVLELR